MSSLDDTLQALREAVQLSPDNVPLRQHYADSLLVAGRGAEAEKEYRHALTLAPDRQPLKLGLAFAFHQQGKHTQALVVVEDLLKRSDTPARAYLLHARLLLQSGESPRAAAQYRAALDADPAVADPDLAQQLGLVLDAGHRRVVSGRRPRSTEAPPLATARGADTTPLDTTPIDRPRLTFADVGGMDALKEEVRLKILLPLSHPQLYAAYGKSAGGGLLLFGPPGCGKTLLARATAGEVRSTFLPVGVNEVYDMWTGQSERNLQRLFAEARTRAPSVLFFDEVDALAASRADLRFGAPRSLINQFLAELDGAGPANQGVLVLAATNAPWHLDAAFRRPGRFDRLLFVPPPDAAARAAILRLLCRDKPLDAIDYAAVAQKTESFSGADLKAVVDQAVERKLREAVKDGVPRPLATRDLLAAAAAVRPSTREWFATARNYALYANHSGLYDDVLKYLKL
jgi:AAA+ superfamily predicted ATPase